jgi:hypothetical protein
MFGEVILALIVLLLEDDHFWIPYCLDIRFEMLSALNKYLNVLVNGQIWFQDCSTMVVCAAVLKAHSSCLLPKHRT